MDSSEQSSILGGTGYLLVRVSTAQGAIPVPGATVTIREHLSNPDENMRGTIIRVIVTDRDGRTERVPLPAPPRSDSMSPNGKIPYASYNIDVEASGYYRQTFSDVPVFDAVTSIQPSLLIPIVQNGNQDGISGDENNFEESVNPALRQRQNNR